MDACITHSDLTSISANNGECSGFMVEYYFIPKNQQILDVICKCLSIRPTLNRLLHWT